MKPLTEYSYHKKDSEKHCFRIGPERFEHNPRQLYIQPHLGRRKRKHKSTKEEHDHRIGKSRHYIFIIGEFSNIVRIHKETESLVGSSQKYGHYRHHRCGPCRNDFQNPHHSRENKNSNDPLLSQCKDRKACFRIYSIERRRHQC